MNRISLALDVVDTVLDHIRSGKIDKALAFIEAISKDRSRFKDDSVEVAITLCKGMIVASTGDNARALEYSRLVLKDLKRIESIEDRIPLLIKAKNLEALSLLNMGKRNEALIRFEENLSLLQNNQQLREDQAICLNNIAYYYLMKGRYEDARRYFEQAIDMLLELLATNRSRIQRYELLLWRFKENLALTLIKQGHFNKALELLQGFLEVAEKREDLLGMVEAFHDLGIINREQGHVEEAQEYFNKALLLARNIHNRRRESMILGDLGELHLKAGQVTEAHQYLIQAIELAQVIHNEEETVKRLCQLGEVEDRLGHHDRALERLNQASRMAQKHGSEEEIEYVKFAVATHYFRKGLLDIAAIFLIDVYNDALALNNGDLQLNSRLYLTAIQISRYLDDADAAYLSDARRHLETIITYAEKQNLVNYVLIGKILKSILHLFALELDEASQGFRETQQLASKVGNEQALRAILNLETILTYFSESLTSDADTVKEMTELFMKQGSLTFLREFVTWTSFTPVTALTSDELADAFIIQGKLGPELYYASSSALRACKEEDLLRSTYALTAVFGQGSLYFEGLYGPIPISRTLIAMVYTKMLPDSCSPDTRYNGRNYCIYMILFPFETRITVEMRECLNKVLDAWFNSITDVRSLTENWFTALHDDLTMNCLVPHGVKK